MNDVAKRDTGAFDVDAWKEELLALNPWARGLTVIEDDETFRAARQSATLERDTLGWETWNAWANEMRRVRRVLEDVGLWAAERKSQIDDLKGKNELTQHWLSLAAAVFSTNASKHTFEGVANFDRFIFPGDADFSGATFSDEAEFIGATFFGGAHFDGTKFSRIAVFGASVFFSATRFVEATFTEEVMFPGASFAMEAIFSVATFTKTAAFSGATFRGEVVFANVTFKEVALFGEVTFKGPINLSQARFAGHAFFEDSTFEQQVNFDAIDSQATFSLARAKFRHVPGFIGATFRGTLRLDNVQTPQYPWLGWTPDKDASARFRELKRRANEAQDRDRELEFFAQEIRTSRFHAKGLPSYVPRVWEWRFWFGLLYGTFSDFGRSLWRPALFWALLLLGFAVFYLGEHEEMAKARAGLVGDSIVMAYAQTTRAALTAPPACIAHGRLFATTDAVTEVLHLSLRNALIFDAGRADAFRRTYGCLFGLAGTSEIAPPIVPPRVSVASTLQSVFSGILIFLLLLAVRNLLRLK